MSDIKFNEFKKVKLDTFNDYVNSGATDPSKRDDYCLNEKNPYIDDNLWGVREDGNSRPVSQLWLGGKKYGEVNPKEEHKLPYYYPEDNTKNQFKFTPDFLLLEDIYVVEDEKEFNDCKGIEVSSPDIKNEWIQYNENASMPEYGVGYSTTENKHIGINTTTGDTGNELYGSGYGLWKSDENHIITNPKNSCDFNAFINPQKSNKFNYTSIIGTNKGRTTGDWGGFALFDDSHAVARHIIDTESNKYYRNALYDLTDDNGVCNSTLTDSEGNTLWCAWVNDLNNGSAEVIYTSQIYKEAPRTTYVEGVEKASFNNGGRYKDRVPEIGDSVTVFYIKNNTTKTDRLKFEDINKTIVVDKIQEAYGYVVTLNVLTQYSNDIHSLHYSGTPYGDIPPTGSTKPTLGTIQVFAEVWPCDGEFFGSRTEYQGGATEIPKQCHFVLGTQTNGKAFTGYDYMLGKKLVPYYGHANVSNSTGYSFIRSDVSFDNGVLNVKFSDLNGQGGVTISDSDLNNLLSNENLNTNFPLNGSELIIDFNSDEYSIKSCDTQYNTVETKTFDSLIYKEIPIKVKNASGIEEETIVNVIDSFKGDVKFGFQQWSFANILIKSNGISYKERLILDTQNDKVWKYDSVEGDYKENVGEKAVDYFTGSHISYNDETKKLFYSNGTNITCIARNCECLNEDDFITESMINVTHDDLLELVSDSGLTPGMQYRLIDYECTVTNYTNATASNSGHFDIILVADTINTLNENVRFTYHEGDEYFADSNLSAWEGKYSLTNDTTKYDWADDSTNGKGVIYWLKDEWNNECPYDFKNIQFKRVAISNIEATGITSDMLSELQTTFVYENNGGICYGQVYGVPSNVSNNGCEINYTFDNDTQIYYYTFTWVDGNGVVQDASIIGQQLTNHEGQYSGVFNNQIQPVSQSVFYPNSPNEFGYSLNNIVFVSSYSFGSGFFYGYYGNKFGVNCCDNTFGNYCCDNTFGNYCWGNTFGNYCWNNTFGNSCYSNTFGNNCYSNTFGNNCYNNTFGNNCYNNTFGNDCYYNTFGNGCYYNTFGNYCGNNTFGNGCTSNKFGNYYHRNISGNYCESNTFGNGSYKNTFGNYFQSNTFGNDCDYNTFTNDNINFFILDDGVQYCNISGITTGTYSPLKNYHFLSNVTSYTLPSDSPSNINYQLVVGRKSDGTIIMVNPMDYLITSINV